MNQFIAREHFTLPIDEIELLTIVNQLRLNLSDYSWRDFRDAVLRITQNEFLNNKDKVDQFKKLCRDYGFRIYRDY